MAGLIKNQILKHLSKFAKNLSNDKLHLSTLKGHGELNNLELDEKVLTELLELPVWLRLTRATCNHLTLKIHWTKLKSEPIHLSLDEVVVVMETCEDLRPLSPMSSDHSYNSGGKYGFSDRVIDGMTVVVNSIVINFSSPTFQASFQLSRVVLESYSPDWKKKDLRLSRIKDADRGELLLFKRLEWQVLRIEAKSKEINFNNLEQDIPLTPLRLITNQACCKMTIKKKLADCTVVGSRLVFVMDDLLWVLTDAQLVAALHFLQSLSGLIKKSTQLMQKQKAKQKIEQQPDKHQHQSKSATRLSPVFNRNDVIETSYHVLCSRIDLHLCDDMDPNDGRSQHPSLKGGGAVQVSLMKLVVDYYPYHRAFASRDHWLRYTEPSSSYNVWVQQLLSLFCDKLQSKGYTPLLPDTSICKAESPKHSTVYRISSLSGDSVSCESTSASFTSSDEKQMLTRKQSTTSSNSETLTQDTSCRRSTASRKLSVQQNYRYLMTSCFVLRLEDIIIYKVATSSTTRKHAIEKFLVYNKHAHLPSEIKTLHLEHTTYYLPGELEYPVPSPNLFLYFGPLKLFLDTATMLWINAFFLNLQKCLMSMKVNVVGPEVPSLVNIRAEALMPQIVIPSDAKSPTQPDRPKTLQLQASRIILSNCRVGDHASHSHLRECLNIFSLNSMLSNTSEFPWHSDDKKKIISDMFWEHTLEEDLDSSPSKNMTSLPKGVISECTNIWNIYLDPFWAEFTVCEAGRTRLQSFIDPLPLTFWCYNSSGLTSCPGKQESKNLLLDRGGDEKIFLHGLKSYLGQISGNASETSTLDGKSSSAVQEKTESDMYLLLHVHSLLNIQLSHFQYLFVLRTIDTVGEMMEHITLDTAAILKDKPVMSVCFVTSCPRVEVSLVLRNLNQLSATSDSVDLASLQEECSSNSDMPMASKQGIAPSASSFSISECCKNTIKQCSVEKCTSMLEDCRIENGVTKSCSDSLLNCHSSGSSQSATTPVLPGQQDFPSESFQKGFHSGTSAMKRGFCSLVASIDSAFTKSDGHSIDGDVSYVDEDTLSLRSDLSCDLDQFVMVNQDGSLEDEFFQHIQHEASVDVAMEAKEDSISNYTLNSEKKREMISVTAFKFNQVGFVMQSELSSCLFIRCNGIETKEETAISWENFQNMFSSRSRSWKLEQVNLPTNDGELSLRIMKDAPPTSSIKSPDNGFVNILAKNFCIPLLMSSVSSLVDFFEDEVTVKPMPLKAVLSNLCIQFKDDGLSTGLSPNSVPLTISLPGCVLERTLDGTLNVLPLSDGYIRDNLNSLLNHVPCNFNAGTETSSLFKGFSDAYFQYQVADTHHVACKDSFLEKSLQSSCDIVCDEIPSLLKLLRENEELKSKVTQISLLQLENQKLKEELKVLRNATHIGDLTTQLAESKIEIKNLEDKKRNLQETLTFLQNEVNSLEVKKKSYNDG